jgi:hypothetical protein|tara:strand:+ start:1150 stop:1371 length:222 start_codon:yes stop_codon:yes gene_type:complete
MEKFCCDCFFNKKHNVVYDNNETELTNYNIYTEKNTNAPVNNAVNNEINNAVNNELKSRDYEIIVEAVPVNKN